VYNVLNVKLDICKKPIYPVLPSVINAHDEIEAFLKKGNINFPDEVVLGTALAQVYKTVPPVTGDADLPKVDHETIRGIIDDACDGYLEPGMVGALLDASGIPRVKEIVDEDRDRLISRFRKRDFPIVMKAKGILHKSDVNGVVLNITSKKKAAKSFDQLMKIEGATGVLAQPMLHGMELFIGVKKEKGFDHTIVCGLGGVFVEILNDISAGLSPLSREEIKRMITSLRGYKLIRGFRNKKGIDEEKFIDCIQGVSALVEAAPEIVEMDVNPLIGTESNIQAVDVRIKIQKG
jgi:acetyltransferase